MVLANLLFHLELQSLCKIVSSGRTELGDCLPEELEVLNSSQPASTGRLTELDAFSSFTAMPTG